MCKTAEKVILKGDRSLDALFSRLQEKFKVYLTPKRSVYLMEPIEVKYDLLRGIKNVRKGQIALLRLENISLFLCKKNIYIVKLGLFLVNFGCFKAKKGSFH